MRSSCAVITITAYSSFCLSCSQSCVLVQGVTASPAPSIFAYRFVVCARAYAAAALLSPFSSSTFRSHSLNTSPISNTTTAQHP